ncbi:hypothetical protein BLA29_000443 [Euroglyphus maynei]|uniref:Uncharacterized protein n=1 Tax=Euroglyphus maynei TaxID=6958 RepID=A0A1Y3BIG3_EURMA|nr:hypothetical protein BLA29_000443 [Euroglyphus maynei]
MRDHLPRITNPVLEQHCQAYTYGPGTCDEALYGVRGRMIDTMNNNDDDHGQMMEPPSTGTIVLQRHLKLKQQDRMRKTNELESNLLESSSGARMEYNSIIIISLMVLFSVLQFN